MMHIIVVSHGHDDIVMENLRGHVSSPLSGCQIIVRDNINSPALRDFCNGSNIRYIASKHQCGFAENNNEVARLLGSEGLNKSDYFIFINPDVLIHPAELAKIRDVITSEQPDLFTIDLYRDRAYSERDPSVRTFPSIIDFASSYLFKKNPTIVQRSGITEPTTIEWCAGSFIGVKTEVFQSLEGFDQRYYMYCEDLDLCYRARKANYNLIYYPQFTAIHEAQCSSQKFLSRHFRWHICSVIRFAFINPISRMLSVKF